jgi:hypothetical protein
MGNNTVTNRSSTAGANTQLFRPLKLMLRPGGLKAEIVRAY